MIKTLTIAALAVFLTGCSITQSVVPVGPDKDIEKIYVENNPDVHMKELVNELVIQIKENGIDAEIFEKGGKPVSAKHTMRFTANWAWDMAMYLTYFKATLYEGGEVIGQVEYNAKSGGANMNKFGRTRDKIQPLLQELLASAGTPEKIGVIGVE